MPHEYPRSGISSYDVERLARRLSGEHGGHITWQLHLPLRKDSGLAFTIRCSFTRAGGGPNDRIYERGVSGTFPGNGGRTLTGELYRLCWELYIKLDEERDDAERATQGRFA